MAAFSGLTQAEPGPDVDPLLDAGVLHEPATAAAFRERYLW